MPNILSAISSIIHNPIVKLVSYYRGLNRINNVGEALEDYIKDILSGSIGVDDEATRIKNYSETFSYIGNQNNPPDLIIKGGDSIEVKKIQSKESDLALNSSYPKNKLYSDSTLITTACRDCEEWDVKDIIYVIGYVNGENLKSLCVVYGDCYAADKQTYERIKETISKGITEIPDVDFTETKELGKVKKVDPLGITTLRVRGMWHIMNPLKVFKYVYSYDTDAQFQMMVIMKKEKFDSFPQGDRDALLNLTKDGFSISDIEIQDPNNSAKLMDAKLITYKLR